MAENKKGFVLYTDQIDLFEDLPDEYAGKLIKHIYRYVNDLNPITDDLVVKSGFSLIKAQLKRDLKKWENTCDARSEAGRLGGIKSGEARRSKTNQNEANEANALNLKQTKQNEHDNVKDNDIVNVKETVKEKDNNKTIPDKSGKKKVSPYFHSFKDLFLKYYNQNSTIEYYWQAKDSVAINRLISQVTHAYKSVGNESPTDTEMNAGFEAILKKALKDKWISQNFEPSIISSKFNNLKTDDTSSTKKAAISLMEDILAGRR